MNSLLTVMVLLARAALLLSVTVSVARHGRQSVRMNVPSEGSGAVVVPLLLKDPAVRTKELSMDPWPFWLKYKTGTKYRVSIWAKAKAPGVQFRLTDGTLDGLPQTFTLTTEWKRYEAEGVAKRDKSYSGLGFQLLGPGTAWFDVFEVVVTGESKTSTPQSLSVIHACGLASFGCQVVTAGSTDWNWVFLTCVQATPLTNQPI